MIDLRNRLGFALLGVEIAGFALILHSLMTRLGGIVDQQALAEALKAGGIGGAGIDVLTLEPPPPDHPLLDPNIPNLILTFHTAWVSR